MLCACQRKEQVRYENSVTDHVGLWILILALGMSYAQIADRIGKPEQHVIDSACFPIELRRELLHIVYFKVCTGAQKPTQAEFGELARALNITSEVCRLHPWNGS